MPLVPCRACGHSVDTSALACPQCGATDPAHKLSRQQRNTIAWAIQFIVIACLLGWGAWYVTHTLIPMARELIVKPQPEPAQNSRR